MPRLLVRLVLIVAAGAVLTGCRRRTRRTTVVPPAVHAVVQSDVDASPSSSDGGVLDVAPEVSADASDDSAADAPFPGEHRVVCGERSDCRVAWAGGVGANARGERRRLLTITGPATTEGTFIEVWLLTAKNGSLIDRQLLVKDGHLDEQAAQSYAADPLHVKHGTLEYTHRWPGISGRWRGMLTETLTLDPPQLVHVEWWGWDAFDLAKDAPRTIDTVDLRTLRGTSTLKGTACGAKVDLATAYVPTVATSALRDHWEGASIGACAAIIDGAASGYMLQGTAKPKDTSYAIAAADSHDLFVEVLDDDVRTPNAVDIGDELELLQSPHYAGLAMLCDPTPAPARYRIQVATGVVTLVSGPVGTKRPDVEVAGGGAAKRLRIRLAEDILTWALAYRDTDDGRSVERIVSTARIRTGSVAELGGVFGYAPVHCAFRDGALRREWPRDPTIPLSVGYGP